MVKVDVHMFLDRNFEGNPMVVAVWSSEVGGVR